MEAKDFVPSVLIEKWMAETINGLDYILYPMGPYVLAAIDMKDWDVIGKKISGQLFNSSILGLFIGGSDYWFDPDIMDAISSAESKTLEVYFSLIRKNRLERNSLTKLKLQVSTVLNQVAKPRLFESEYLNFENVAFVDIYSTDYLPLEKPLVTLAKRIEKPVCVLLRRDHNDIIDKELFEKCFKISFAINQGKKFEKNFLNNSYCFGSNIDYFYCPEKRPNNESGYSRFEYIVKDTFSNIICAVAGDNELIITVHATDIINIISCVCDRYKSTENFVEVDKNFFKNYLDNNKKNYVSVAKQLASKFIQDTTHRIEELKNEYDKALNITLEKSKLYMTLKNQFDYFDASKFELDQEKEYYENYQLANDIDRVASIIINDNGVVTVNTKEIYVKDERNGKWHEIGTFAITIGMHSVKYNVSETINIKNTKYGSSICNQQAPHVFQSGNMCHGNIVSMMVDAYSHKNLYEMVTLLIMFLSAANTADAFGSNVDQWPEVSENVAKGIVKKYDVKLPVYKGAL